MGMNSQAESKVRSIMRLQQRAESAGAVQTVRNGVVAVNKVMAELESLTQKAETNQQDTGNRLKDADTSYESSRQESKEAKATAAEREQLALTATHERVLAEQASNRAKDEVTRIDLDSENARNILGEEQTALSLKQGIIKQLTDKIAQTTTQMDLSATEMQVRSKAVQQAQRKLDAAQTNLHKLRIAMGEIDEGGVVSLDVDDEDARITS